MTINPQLKRSAHPPYESCKLFWMDAIHGLACREKMLARMNGQNSDTGCALYVLPSTLAKTYWAHGTFGAHIKYRAHATIIDYRYQFGFRDIWEVDIATALKTFQQAETTATIRALSNAYDLTSELDILVIEPAYLAYAQTAVNRNERPR